MTNAFKKSFTLCLSLIIVIAMCVPSFAQETEKVTRLDIQKKYNPLRNEEYKQRNGVLAEEDFHDEDVHIERVTYYDKNKNKIKKYVGEKALEHLYHEANQQVQVESDVTMRDNGYSGDFEYQTTESFVESDSNTTVIKEKAVDMDYFSTTELVFNAGMAFADPVYSVLVSAVSQFLPESISYKAGDVAQTEYYRFRQNLVEMRKIEPYTGDWFPVVRAQKRIVTLATSFYLVNEDGDLTTFEGKYGTVEENYNKYYDDNDKLISDALLTWNVWPYEHIYS